MNDHYISAEASILGKLQYENDVIFVAAGTNKPNDEVVKTGSPADSINSMIVNAVTKNGLSAKYARRGLALSYLIDILRLNREVAKAMLIDAARDWNDMPYLMVKSSAAQNKDGQGHDQWIGTIPKIV